MTKIFNLDKVNKTMATKNISKNCTETLDYKKNEAVSQAVYTNYSAPEILARLKEITPEEIVDTYNPKGIYPFDIFNVLKELGILVAPYDFTKLENTYFKEQVKKKGKILGAVVANDNKIAIFYDKNSSINRINFTLAHELAHCCLDLNFDTSKGRLSHMEFRNDSKDWIDIREYNANIFAGEILIPKEPLDYVFENLIEPSVYNLSKFFGVSKSVMLARLKYLDYIQ